LFPQKPHEKNDVLTIAPPDGHGHYEAVIWLQHVGQKCSVMVVQYNQSSSLLKTYKFLGLIAKIMLSNEVAKYIYILQ